MKTSIKLLVSSIVMLSFCHSGNAQFFKKLAKKAEKAAERTVERRVEQESAKKTDQALDSVLGTGNEKQKVPNTPPSPNGQQGESGGTSTGTSSSGDVPTSGPKTLNVYSKFDFVPGDKLLFFDDFSNDFIGDFPSKWNTNGGGEMVTIDGSTDKWFAINPGSFVVPITDFTLPEEYTVELDLRFLNLTNKTSSVIEAQFICAENANLSNKDAFAMTDLNPVQYIAVGPEIRNKFAGDPDPIRNQMKSDFRKVYKERMHISIAVNKNRYRFWINETKIFDIPQLIKDPSKINNFKIFMRGLNLDKGERMLISNLKIAEGGVDLRRKLMAEGKISTNGILFDSGSANIKPESMGIIRQIYQVLQQDGSISLKIVGHTDSDGNEANNLALSEKRAAAVKDALVSVYGVDSGRLSSEGKGESEPVGDNSTLDGKAQNRRVEFIKQ
ncbi:OmpA family protein [Flagellimonas meridianipacifica]|uniref:Outer membrane protein OmpA-like peptidoglycan-associated protein n=1 Tax=Flagellimonas meridianipacifica TaxID=1080225 RepID=A0A2T0MEM4_9FLAO|nr:OmpA family protein [Allomuricauda pacifica]PRX56018.1 outer membrane protein OmpA-like peptidoglycan-associated protein [Allomuricauda pacifica]